MDRKVICAFFDPFLGDSLTSKNINTPKIFVLCIITVFMIAPAVAAGKIGTVSSGNGVNTDTDKINYIIQPAEGSQTDTSGRIYPLGTYTISKGQTRTQTLPISSGVRSIEVDFDWYGAYGNVLTLTVKDPANYNLGVYYDNADGQTNGRIHVFIYSSTGYIKPGKWVFSEYGQSVSGTQNYKLMFYTR